MYITLNSLPYVNLQLLQKLLVTHIVTKFARRLSCVTAMFVETHQWNYHSQLPAVHTFTACFINTSLNIIVPSDLGLIPIYIYTHTHPISYLFIHYNIHWLPTSVALPETRSGCLFYRHYSLPRGKKIQADGC
jgi:hypothetical protein